jgi:hypothetical protein
MLSKPSLSIHTFVFQISFIEFVSIVKLCCWFRSCSWLSLSFASWILVLVLLCLIITSRSDSSLSSLVFWSYLTHTNLDFYVLVFSGKLEKLSTTLVLIRVLVNTVIIVKIAVGLNLFVAQNFLSSQDYRVNIFYFCYAKKAFLILKSKRKERSTTFYLYVLEFEAFKIAKSALQYSV